MPAEKAGRQSVKRYQRNRSVRTATRTATAKALDALESGDVPEAESSVLAAITFLDRAVRKGVLRKQTVARRKSRISARLNQLRRA